MASCERQPEAKKVSITFHQVGKWLLIFGFQCALAVIAFEVATKYLFPDSIAAWRLHAFGSEEIQFISRQPFGPVTGNYTPFAPNSTIRLVSYYPDNIQKVTMEYDCTFRTDKRGFLSNDGDYLDREILLVGDSFTAGWGGCDWVSRLEPDVRSRIYVAALNGTGPIVWKQIVTDLAALKEPRRILVVFITDDFFRGDMLYPKSQHECLRRAAGCSGQWLFPITQNMNDVAAARYAERANNAGLKGTLLDLLPASRVLMRMMKGVPNRDMALLRKSANAMSDLSKRYELKLLWVNEKRETNTRPLTDTRLVQEELSKMGLHPIHCYVPFDGFLPRDNHPNKEGYEHIRKCVQFAVRSWNGG